MTPNRGTSYCESRFWGGAGIWMASFARNWPLAAQLGPGTVRKRFVCNVTCSGFDSQPLVTILDTFRSIFTNLGPAKCLLLRQDRCLLLRQDRCLLFRKALALPGRAVVSGSTRRGLTRGEESEEWGSVHC